MDGSKDGVKSLCLKRKQNSLVLKSAFVPARSLALSHPGRVTRTAARVLTRLSSAASRVESGGDNKLLKTRGIYNAAVTNLLINEFWQKQAQRVPT